MENNTMLETLRAAENVQPVAISHGMKIVSFEDQRNLAQAELITGYDAGDRTTNADGSIARSRAPYAAVNFDSFFINRYRKVKNTLQIVTDYRAIQEQAGGRVYVKQLPAYVIVRGEDGELKLDKVVTISDAEFVADFTHMLSHAAMAQILPVLSAGDTEPTADDLSI